MSCTTPIRCDVAQGQATSVSARSSVVKRAQRQRLKPSVAVKA
jgi:hypothetical protein